MESDRASSQDPAFRSARARLAALALHQRRPEIARLAGRKGAEATLARSPYGRRGWAVYMATRRWHPTAVNRGSRAPTTGPGVDGGGAPEPGPVTAR